MLFIVYLVRCSFAIRYSQVQTLKKMKTIFISRSFFCFRAVKVLSYLLCARALAVNSSSLGAFFVFFSHSLSIFFRFSFCSACTNTHTEFFLIFFSVVSFSFFFFGSLFHAALTLSAHWVFYFNFFFFHIRFLKCVYCVQRFFLSWREIIVYMVSSVRVYLKKIYAYLSWAGFLSIRNVLVFVIAIRSKSIILIRIFCIKNQKKKQIFFLISFLSMPSYECV